MQWRLLFGTPPRGMELGEASHDHAHVRLVRDALGALVLQRVAAHALRAHDGVLDEEAEFGRRGARVCGDVVAAHGGVGGGRERGRERRRRRESVRDGGRGRGAWRESICRERESMRKSAGETEVRRKRLIM